jgi:hypothetical protein
MELFILALLEAVAVALIAYFLGKKTTSAFTAIGTTVMLLPLALIMIGGAIKMMGAPPETVGIIGNDTIASVIALITGQLPSVMMSDVAGALVGAVVGVFALSKRNSWN